MCLHARLLPKKNFKETKRPKAKKKCEVLGAAVKSFGAQSVLLGATRLPYSC